MAGQRRTAQDRQRCTGGIRLCRDANANAVAALLSATADADQTQTRRRLGARPCPVQVVLVLSRRLPARGFICVYQSSACRACCHLLSCCFTTQTSTVHRLPSLLRYSQLYTLQPLYSVRHRLATALGTQTQASATAPGGVVLSRRRCRRRHGPAPSLAGVERALHPDLTTYINLPPSPANSLPVQHHRTTRPHPTPHSRHTQNGRDPSQARDCR